MKSKQNKRVMFIVQAAIIAALYAALTWGQNLIFPNSTSMAVQFRASEALTVLSFFTPSAIVGLTVGCFLANIMNLSVLPLDVVLGSLASLLACAAMYSCRSLKIKGVPLPAMLFPALFNGVIIGLEIEIFFIDGPFNFISFLIQAGLVALGELLVLYTLGVLLTVVITKNSLERRLSLSR